MKRFIICSLLIIGLLWAGNWSFGRLTEVKEQVLAEIDGISQLVEQGDLQTAWERAAALEQEWEKKEHSILAFVRHGDLVQVTLSISKLPGYLRYGEVSAYAAEANTVRRMMIHIWESEQFVLTNIA